MRPEPARSPAREKGLIFLSYLVLSILFLWPLSKSPADTVAYVGDSLATVYFTAENGRRLFSDPGSLFSAGVAFPHESAALFEAHRLLPALLAAPLIAFTSNPILAINLLGWMAYAFNAWGAFWLGRTLGISRVAAFGAGALFAFNTYAVLEQPRLNIVILGFIPLAIVEALAFARTGGARHAWRGAVLWLLQAFTENYSAIYGGAAIVVVLVLAVVTSPPEGGPARRLRAATVPSLVVALAFLPVVIAYARMDAVYDFRRESPYSLDLSHFLATQPGNLLYGKIGPPVRAQQQGAHFIGFGALLLGGIALWRARLRPAMNGGWVLAAFGFAVALALLAAGRSVNLFGHRLMPGPYGWLFDHGSLFERTRIPERFGLLMMLPVSLLAGRGIDIVSGNRRAFALILALFLPLEHAQRFPWMETLPVGRDIPAVYAWLRTSDARAVVEAPAHGEGLVRMESVDMYFQLFHHKPIVSAYLSFPPLLTRILRQTTEELPDEKALRTLALAGVDTLVYHQEGPSIPSDWADAEAAGRITRRGSFPREAYWLRPSGRDLVFSISAARPLPPRVARAPLARIRSGTWRYRASAGRAALAGDGDKDSQWIIEDTVRGGEYFEIGFGGDTVRLSAVALPMTRRDILPTRFEVETRDQEGRWSPFASYGPTKRDELVRDLMESPGRAVVTLEGEEVSATGLRLVAGARARSFDGWRLGEVEVLTAPGGLK